jgi:hypothetical protein
MNDATIFAEKRRERRRLSVQVVKTVHRRGRQPQPRCTGRRPGAKLTKRSRVGSSGELLPLIEPDMQISSIRLTDTRRRKSTQAVDGVVVTET